MAIVNYHCAKGRLLGEDTNGIRTDYMTDALGSVTGTVNSSQAVVNTYRYKPFGELLAKTGTGADPKFMWNGGTQSRRTGIAYSEQYNRARHYGTRQGQWTTVDPLWPRERAYGYAIANAVNWPDPAGLCVDECCCCPGEVSARKEREFRNETYYKGKGAIKNFIGVRFGLRLSWLKQTSSQSTPVQMPSCTLKWEEWWHSPGNDKYSTGGDEDCFTKKSTYQQQQWEGEPCPRKRLCAFGSCSITDHPGIRITNPNISGFSYQICFRFTLSSSCGDVPGCKGPRQIVKYYKFSLKITKEWDGINKGVDLEFKESDAGCDPKAWSQQ